MQFAIKYMVPSPSVLRSRMSGISCLDVARFPAKGVCGVDVFLPKALTSKSNAREHKHSLLAGYEAKFRATLRLMIAMSVP